MGPPVGMCSHIYLRTGSQREAEYLRRNCEYFDVPTPLYSGYPQLLRVTFFMGAGHFLVAFGGGGDDRPAFSHRKPHGMRPSRSQYWRNNRRKSPDFRLDFSFESTTPFDLIINDATRPLAIRKQLASLVYTLVPRACAEQA